MAKHVAASISTGANNNVRAPNTIKQSRQLKIAMRLKYD